MRQDLLRSGLTALLLLGCGDSAGPGNAGPTAELILVQTARNAPSVRVRVENSWSGPIAAGTSSGVLVVPAGSVSVFLEPTGGAAATAARTLDLAEGSRTTMIALDSAGYVVPAVLADTNAIVAAGKSKVRVVHAATNAPALDILRTQPDFPTPIKVMFPFAYQAMSPYLESDPGDWEVIVAHENQSDTLGLSGAFTVGDGGLATVIVMDGTTAGTVSFVVVHDN